MSSRGIHWLIDGMTESSIGSTFCACGRSKDLWHLSLSIFSVCFFLNPSSSCFDFNAKVPWPSQVHVSQAPLNQSEMSNRNSVHFLYGYILEVFSLSLSPLQSPSLIYHLLSKQEQSLAPYTLLPLASHQHPSLQNKHRVKTHVIGPHLSKRQSFKNKWTRTHGTHVRHVRCKCPGKPSWYFQTAVFKQTGSQILAS